MSETEYPSWRDALADNSKIANLRCAVKYVCWHGAYIVLALFGLLVIGVAKLLDKLSGSSTARRVGNGVTSPRAKKVSRIFWNGLLILYLAGCIFVGGYMLVSLLLANPVATVGAIIAILVLTALLIVGGSWMKRRASSAGSKVGSAASTVGSKAVKTPGVRRVYGNCPVHMDLEPHWFEDLFER